MKKFLFVLFVCFSFKVNAQEAKRVVSLVPWVTKTFYLMGEQDKLVGCTSYCNVEPVDNITVVASAMSVNLEKAISLKPDLVIASSLIKPETIDNLRKLGIKVIFQPYPKNFDEICRYFVQIGETIGRAAKANEIVKEQKLRLEKVKAKVPKNSSPEILIQIGAKPLFCAVPDTFMDDFITFSGGKNIASEIKSGGIVREFVIKENPDVIFIVTMGIVAEEEKTEWLKYSSLSAAKNRKVFILDADKTCSPTPILFVDALEEMIGLIYKK